VLTLLNHCRNGERTGGFITKILEDGFSGIAVITWGAAVRMMSGKSNDGAPCGGTLRRSGSIARAEKPSAGPGNVKRFFTGLTIRESSE
jgi:hypothetical protein